MDQAGLRPAQVGASTAAAVAGAFLASRLGVYGTIIGVGVISLMSMAGGEMLLRSLDRTKQVARATPPRQRTKATAPPAVAQDSLDEAATAEQSVTAILPARSTVPDGDQPSRAPRWPLVAGGFLASFGLALAVIAGIESFTGRSLDGDASPTLVTVLRGGDQGANDSPSVPTTPSNESDWASPSEPADGTTPEPEPATPTPTPSPTPPDNEDEAQPPDEETAPPGDEDEPTPPEGETPPDEEETPAP